jgi:hypothetical protein
MRVYFQIIAFVLLGLFTAGDLYAQIGDPTSWTYEAKKKSGNEYEIVFHLTLKEGWHIWSVTPGGDGTLIAPSFTFDKNEKIEVKGKIKQVGKMVTETMEGIEGKVNFYNGQVDYIQTLVVKGPTKITGKHEYQVCNAVMCLPPKDRDFSMEIGK